MKIAVIGTGKVGGTLATRFAEAGHTILLGSRHPEDEKTQQLIAQNITAHSIPEAVKAAEVIIVAAPAAAGADVARELGDLSGKVVIDVTNAVFSKPAGYNTVADALLALCNTSDVVKCFNSTGYENMANPDYNGTKADMFIAGDSKKGKDIATKLAQDIGFGEVYDLGGNQAFGLTEQLCLVWVTLARGGYGRDIAFKILKR